MNVRAKQTMLGLLCAMLLLLALGHAALADRAQQLYGEANELHKQGDYSGAIAAARQVVVLKSDSGLSWLLIGECYVQLNKPEEAIKALDRALPHLEPGHALGLCWLLKAESYEKLDELEHAIKAIEEGLPHLEPGSDEQLEAINLLKTCVQEINEPEPDKPPDKPLATASTEDLLIEAFVGANWPRVIELGEKITKQPDSPQYKNAHYFVGMAYLQLDRASLEALKYLRDYLKLSPDGPYAEAVRKLIEPLDSNRFYSLVAEIEEALDTGELAKAREKTEEARKMRKPGHDLTYLNGLTFVLGGQEDKAIHEFERYLSDAPSGRFVHSCKVWLYELRSPWLVVIRNEQVLRIFTDGTKPRAISRVDEHGKAEQALISPDGRMIAFVAWNEKPNTRNVFVCHAFGSEPHGIFDSGGGQSAIRDLHWFQHDRGLWLTFVGEDKARDYGIFLYDSSRIGRAFMLEGSRSSPANAKNLRCQWSPDAEHLAWIGGDGHLRATQLSTLSTAVKLEDRFEVRDFAWGPRVTSDLPGFLIWTNGHQIFRRDVTPDFLSGGQNAHSRPYINIPQGHISKLGVSADGTLIGAWDRRSETLHLYVAHPRMSPLGVIEGVQMFAFSNAGRQLAYSTSESIYVTNMVRDIPPTRVRGTRGITEFAWSPVTPELLVWQSDWVCLTVDGKPRAGGRTRESEGPFVEPRWSPDASRVAIQRNAISAREPGSVWVLTTQLPELEQLHLVLPSEQGPFYLVGWTS